MQPNYAVHAPAAAQPIYGNSGAPLPVTVQPLMMVAQQHAAPQLGAISQLLELVKNPQALQNLSNATALAANFSSVQTATATQSQRQSGQSQRRSGRSRAQAGTSQTQPEPGADQVDQVESNSNNNS